MLTKEEVSSIQRQASKWSEDWNFTVQDWSKEDLPAVLIKAIHKNTSIKNRLGVGISFAGKDQIESLISGRRVWYNEAHKTWIDIKQMLNELDAQHDWTRDTTKKRLNKSSKTTHVINEILR